MASTPATTASPLVEGRRSEWRTAWSLRSRVFWHRLDLDRRIAQGVRTDDDPELILRAEQLLRRRTRRGIARGLERVVSVAEARAKQGLSSMAPVQRHEVREARGAILSLAQALRAGADVNPRGVATAQILVTDCASPLCYPVPPGTLLEVTQRARDHLLDGK